ncbi:iron-containing alcohol dehydrogenase [Spirillospora sp. NBC_00431]
MTVSLVLPRIIEIGVGASDRIAAVLDRLGARRPLIVTDAALAGSGTLDRPLRELSSAGIAPRIFADTSPDPTTAEVSALVERLARGDVDSLVAIGGGSPMDTAKAAAVQLGHGGRPLRELKVPFSADAGGLPLVCVPTTAGTGSEVTRFCVITDVDTNEKMLIAGAACVASAALVDAGLTRSMPRRVTADSGLDALTHAVEAFISHRHNEHADLFAVSGVRRALTYLRRAWTDPDDLEARTEMMLGATHAGMAFTASSVALVHGMSRPVGAFFHIPHGMGNAMLLSTLLRWTLPHASGRLAELARAAGVAGPGAADATAGHALSEAITDLVRALEIPTLSEFGVDRADWFSRIPAMAEQAVASGSPANNPGDPTRQDIERLYEQVWA